jgi:hypothetical protein
MDRALGEGCYQAILRQCDSGERSVVRQHRDHHVSAADAGHISGLMCAKLNQWAAPSGAAVEDADVLACLEQIARHRRAHLTEPNESDFHVQIS